MGKLRNKELGRFEDLPCFLEFLQLAFCLLEFVFLFLNVLAQAIDLADKDLNRTLLLPGLAS